MIRPLNLRERALLGIALTVYEDLAKGVRKGLKRLGLSEHIAEAAIGDVKAIRMLLATNGESTPIEFRQALRTTARKALELVSQRTEKSKAEDEQFLIPIDRKEEYEYELKALRRAFGEQIELADVVEAAKNGDNGDGETKRRGRGGRQGLDDMPAPDR